MNLKFKENKWLYAFVIACVLLVAAIIVAVVFATQKGPGNEPTQGVNTGEGVGIYYYEMADGEILLTLSEGKIFTLAGPRINKTGTYTISDSEMVLDFVRDEDGTTTANIESDAIVLTYQDATMTFRKKVQYTVSFNCDGAVQTQSVINGKTAVQPADPAKAGHVFLGWYADEALTELFAFETAVVSDLTVYAKWVPTVVGQPAYTVDFDLGYADAQNPEAVQTVGGKLHTKIPEPEREGYTFCGWWISMYEDGEKLSYAYTDDMVFDADTTLFALWADNANTKLQAPEVSVGATSVSWATVKGASGYQIVITNAEGIAVLDEPLGATTQNFDFEALPEGDYKVEVIAVAPNTANNSQAAVRYYKNKALPRVSQFQVIDGVLAFNAVENAQKYLITIECGNDKHDHQLFDNGNSTTFRFADCTMQPGGIKITVTAAANGYASSVSEVFVYDRSLAAVENIVYNEEEDLFVWDRVENATGYVVTVTVAGETKTFRIGNKTSFSTAGYSGEIAVAVVPVTDGYNSPEAATATHKKIAPATPSGIQVSGMVISWEAAMGAESYEVKIGSQVFQTNTNSLDLAVENAGIVAGEYYAVSVKAISGNESSPYSEPMEIGYRVMCDNLIYTGNTVYWTPVIGANEYEVRVNGVTVTNVAGQNYAPVTLTQAGINTISVRFTDNGGSEWVSVEVRAFKVTYDSRSLDGEEVEYVAIGDTLSLPEHFTNNGFTFAGWYNAPSASAGNGKKIESAVFTGNSDVVYYADWTPESYRIHMQVEGYDLTNMAQDDFFTVTYTHNFTLPVPVSSNPVYTSFVGWFTGPSGSATRLTDEKGVSVAPFSSYQDVFAYPFFDTDLLAYELSADGTYYEVKAGPNIDNVTTVTIPSTYDGVKVKNVLENGFATCRNLKIVNIPNTIEIVGTGAFSGATALEQINVYEVEGNHDIYYSSYDGALLRHDMGTVYLDVFPRAKTGTYTMPENVDAIRSKAFQLSSISRVIISKSVSTIYEKAFYRCASLTSVEFQGGRAEPLSIQSEIFYSCPEIAVIKLPAKLNEFDPTIFNSLTKLSLIEVEEGGDQYGSVNGILTNAIKDTILYAPNTISGAFTVPKGIQHIADGAFQGRTGITSITIPNYVKTIGASAFADCTKVKFVTFAGSRKNDLSIGASAFRGCATLDTVTFAGSTNGELEKGIITIGASAFAPAAEGEKRLRTVEFKDGVNIAEIGTSAFANQSALYALSFGNNIRIEQIGASAFENNILLTSISIPASTVSIGNNAFKGCTGVTAVTFSEGGNEIAFGTGAFLGCTKLTEINLPSTLVNFDGTVFKGCDAIRQINVAANSPYLTAENGVLYNKNYTALLFYPKALDADWDTLSQLRWDTITTIGDSVFADNTKVTTFQIMKNVTSIGANAFSGCTKLTTLTSEIMVADGVSRTLEIGTSAFGGCKALRKASIPAYTKSIGSNAFYQSAFMAFEMPADVTGIGDCAFKNNTQLMSITIPANVTSIGLGAFYNCTGLEEVIFVEGGALLTLGNTTGGEGVFQKCFALHAVDFKNRVTVIGSHTFDGSGIRNNAVQTGLVLDSNVTEIGSSAFANTKTLNFLTIPAGVTAIGNQAFSNSIVSRIDFEPGGSAALAIGARAFENTSITNITFPSRTDVLYGITKVMGGAELYNIADLFAGSTQLKNIHVEPGCAKFTSVDGVLYELNENGDPSVLLFCPALNEGAVVNGVATGELIVPKTVVSVTTRALRDITKIHTVTFQEFDPSDERYGTQRLYIGYADPSHSVPEGYEVIGGLATNTITTINIPSHIAAFSAYAISTTQNTVVLNINPHASEIVLGINAFCASRIEDFNFPGVKKMENLVFTRCNDAKTIVFGDKSTLENIPTNAFNGAQIQSFVVPASVTTLDSQAFFFAKGLESVSFAEGSQLKIIGAAAFQGCVALVELDMTNVTKLESIGDRVFQETKIASFTFPASIKSAGSDMFASCKELTEVNLPETFTAGMLYNLDSYGNHTSIFNGCVALQTINVAAGNMELISVDGVLYDKIQTIVFCYPMASTLQNYQIPETVRIIEKYAFKGYPGSVLALPAGLEVIEANAFEEAKVEHFVIPAGVTRIGYRAFASAIFEACLKSITFEPGSRLESIGAEAFYFCKLLESIAIPDSVKTIGTSAFTSCTALETVILPAALTELADNTFARCTSLRSVILQQGLSGIGKDVFLGAPLTSLHIPASVRTIADNAFEDLTKLTIVTFAPGSVLETVGASAFEGCSLLHSINLPAQVKTIGENAFKGNGNLIDIQIPAALTEIPNGMFDGCSRIESITIPEGVTSIGDRAFANNASIAAIDIPAAVTNIGTAAFEGCTSATRIAFAPGSAVQELGSDVLGKDNIFKDTVSVTTLILPENLTFIGGHVFENCGADSLVLPGSISEIGEYAFANCDNIQEVTVSGDVLYLGDYAFFDCDALTNATLSFGIEYLGTLVFGCCEKLTTAYIPATVIRIGSNPFAGCIAAGDVTVDPDNGHFLIEDGVLYDTSKTVLYYYPSSKTEETFTIPETVTQVAAGAFAGSQLKSVVFPSRLQTIEPYTFAYCPKLESVTIESGVKSIGDGAFRGCAVLNNVTIPRTASNLGNYAFADCASLSKFTFTNKTSSSDPYIIGTHFFENCTSLQTLVLPNYFTLTVADAMNYPELYNKNTNKLTASASKAFPSYMFAGSGLVSIKIPNTIRWLGTDGVFMNCKDLEKVTFASSSVDCKYIGNYYFYGCSKLETITIPRGAMSIFSNTIGYSFADCTSLKSITIGYSGTLSFAGATSGHMFEGCSSLTTIKFKGMGAAVGYMEYVGPYYFAGCTSLQSITLADNAAICQSAFENCTALTSISFGEENASVLLLGNRAFAGCTNLTDIILPALPDYMGEGVFAGWTQEQKMQLRESAEQLEQILYSGIFKGCQAVIYDPDMNVIEIDPETGLRKNP